MLSQQEGTSLSWPAHTGPPASPVSLETPLQPQLKCSNPHDQGPRDSNPQLKSGSVMGSPQDQAEAVG